jgi:uncharacterized protein YecE (DUF72 family)
VVNADPVRVARDWSGGGKLRYYRLHGSPRVYWSSYTESQLNAVAMQISDALKIGQHVWCIFDNTAGGAAWNNAQTLNEKLRGER